MKNILRKIITVGMLFIFTFSLCSCNESKMIFPFEADLEKHFSSFEKDYVADVKSDIILENVSYSIGIDSETDALWFYDKNSDVYYDSEGNTLQNPSEASVGLYVFKDGEIDLSYKKGEFYDVVFDKMRPTLTAFYISDNTVRLVYILGLEQLLYIGSYPIVLSENTYKNDEIAFEDVFVKTNIGCGSVSENFVSEYCTCDTWFELSDDFGTALASYTNTDSNTVRTELLNLGYNPDKAKILLFCTDISLENDGITVDISVNRQYKSYGLRTSMYSVGDFCENIPFVTLTSSESERIYYAGSQY